jgi:hypothetical protein
MPKLKIQTPFGGGDATKLMTWGTLIGSVAATIFAVSAGQKILNKVDGAFGGRLDTSPELHQYTSRPQQSSQKVHGTY